MGGGSSKPKAPTVAAPTVSSVDRAVLDLKVARDKLQRYRTRLETDQERILVQARKAKAEGKKERALGLLRLKKYKNDQAKNCEDQLLNVLQMVDTIDSKQNEQQMLNALRAGKDSLQKMHKETTVEDVLNLMDDIKEEVEVEREISQILQDVPELSPEDEMAVEAELEALQKEMEGISEEPMLNLPEVPTTKLPEVIPTPVAQKQVSKPERVAIPG